MSTASAVGSVSAQDGQYLQRSVAGGLFEIEGGQMAQQRGQSTEVKQLGARLASDHAYSQGEVSDHQEDITTRPRRSTRGPTAS